MDEAVKVWVRDGETGKVRCSDGWHGEGFPGFSAWWWAEGSGSCDCNRAEMFGNSDEEEGRCRSARYRIIRVEPMPEGYTLTDFNRGYPNPNAAGA